MLKSEKSAETSSNGLIVEVYHAKRNRIYDIYPHINVQQQADSAPLFSDRQPEIAFLQAALLYHFKGITRT